MRLILITLLTIIVAACQEKEAVRPEIQDLPKDMEGLEKLLATNPDNNTMLEAYWQLYKIHRGPDPSIAMEYLQRQEELAEASGNHLLLGKAYFGKGKIYMKMEEHILAVDNYTSSVHAFEKADQPRLMAIALNNLGVVFMQTGSYEYAEKFVERAHTIHTELGETTEQARALLNLGICNYSKKEPDYVNAVTYIEKGLSLTATIGEGNKEEKKHLYNRLYTQLGIIHYKKKEYQAAVDNYLHALQYIDNEDNNDEKVIAYANTGEALMESGEFEEAQKWLTKALNLSGSVTAGNNLVIYNILGKLHHLQNDHQQSVVFLEKAIETANKEAINQHLQETLQLIRVSYKALNESGKAVSSHRYDHVLEVDGKQDVLEAELIEKLNFQALQTVLNITVELNKEKQQKQAEAALKAFYIKVALTLLFLIVAVTVYLRYRNKRIRQQHESFKDELFGKVERFLHKMEN